MTPRAHPLIVQVAAGMIWSILLVVVLPVAAIIEVVIRGVQCWREARG